MRGRPALPPRRRAVWAPSRPCGSPTLPPPRVRPIRCLPHARMPRSAAPCAAPCLPPYACSPSGERGELQHPHRRAGCFRRRRQRCRVPLQPHPTLGSLCGASRAPARHARARERRATLEAGACLVSKSAPSRQPARGPGQGTRARGGRGGGGGGGGGHVPVVDHHRGPPTHAPRGPSVCAASTGTRASKQPHHQMMQQEMIKMLIHLLLLDHTAYASQDAGIWRSASALRARMRVASMTARPRRRRRRRRRRRHGTGAREARQARRGALLIRRANEHLAATTLLRHSSLARRPESSARLARSQLAPSLPAARCTNDPASRLLTATLREASLAQGAREGVDCVGLSDDSDEAPREAQASAGASGGANGVSAEGASGGGGSAAVGGRRQAAAEAAQRAAARFANWEVGGEATAEPRHWPGPWATAMDLAEGVERVREEREEARRERAKAPVTPRWRPPALEADNSSARDGASLRRSRSAGASHLTCCACLVVRTLVSWWRRIAQQSKTMTCAMFLSAWMARDWTHSSWSTWDGL